MDYLDTISDLPVLLRVLSIAVLAILAHLLVRLIQRGGEWMLSPGSADREVAWREHPRLITIVTIVVSALTFAIYFAAFGFILSELGISLTAYVASASVIGLAVGFGSQGLVQDVVIGLTLIFSDILHVGEMVDISGQTGRVERIGLRFTTLVNLLNQRVHIPNRNISQINRYHKGYIRAYVDVQVPEGNEETRLHEIVVPIARGMHAQYGAVILTEPEVMGVHEAVPGGWRYLRVKFRLWPGQGTILETSLKQRLLAALKQVHPDYADWMVTVTYRAE